MNFSYWLLYGIGLGGALLHIAKKVKGQRLGSLWQYVGEHSLQVAMSWLTYTLVFVGWIYQPALAASLGFSHEPGPLSVVLLAYASDSLLVYAADRNVSKAP